MSDAEALVARRLLQGLAVVLRCQHPSGEIVAFRHDDQGNHVYRRAPYVSAHVHEALACFDPTDTHWDAGALNVLPRRQRARFERDVVTLRRRIRGFLLWQQEPEGWWRFHGRGSGIDPDAATTAAAAVAVAESHSSRSLQRWERQLTVMGAFAAADGAFGTFRNGNGAVYGWMDAAGGPVEGIDLLVNLEVLRFLAAAAPGEPGTAALAAGGLEAGTPLSPDPLTSLRAAARVQRQTGLLAGAVPALLAALGAAVPAGPLGAAMRAQALLDLDAPRPDTDAARLAVLRTVRSEGGWGYEDFVLRGYGSPALSSALAIAFLAGDAAAHGAREAA